MDIRGHVCVFCKKCDPNADDAVVDYLTGIIQDAETDNVDLEEIEDVVTGFFPNFASLREEEKHEALWSLLQKGQVSQCSAEEESVAETPKVTSMLSAAEAGPRPPVDARAAPPGWTPCCVNMETGGHEVEALANLWPEEVPFCSEYAAHILHAKGLGCVETTANWTLEIGPQNLQRQQQLWMRDAEREAEAREAAKRAEKEARKKTLAKFSLQPETTAAPTKGKGKQGGSVEPWTSTDNASGRNGVRYRDGQLVSTRGEKFIMETISTEWNGGSTGKVYTKGKRGKGVV
ncbi:hypothetical protein COCOBI_05-2230 [Coccomyxa sp. Obi]|nr:hypothetical protein COCOBI_05-2230 [Coccomyxa sp. Obi]